VEQSVEVHLYVSELSPEAHIKTQVKQQLTQRRRDLKRVQDSLKRQSKDNVKAQKKELQKQFADQMRGLDEAFAAEITPHQEQRAALVAQKAELVKQRGGLKGKKDHESVAERKRLTALIDGLQQRSKEQDVAVKGCKARVQAAKKKAKAEQKLTRGQVSTSSEEGNKELVLVDADCRQVAELLKAIQPRWTRGKERRSGQPRFDDEKLGESLDQHWETYPTLRAAIVASNPAFSEGSLLHTVETTRFRKLELNRRVYQNAMRNLKAGSVDAKLFQETDAFGSGIRAQGDSGIMGWLSQFVFGGGGGGGGGGSSSSSSVEPEPEWFVEAE
jgi:hypothetical protein